MISRFIDTFYHLFLHPPCNICVILTTIFQTNPPIEAFKDQPLLVIQASSHSYLGNSLITLATKFQSLLFQKPLSWLAPCSLRLVLCKEGNIAWMSKEPTCDIITSVLAWTLNTEVNAGLWRIGTICSKLSPISIEPVNFQTPLL